MTHRSAEMGILNVLSYKHISTFVFAILLAGCGANVVLDSPSIPTPLVVKIPATVALRIPSEFQSYIHEEEVIGREQWSINLGSANATFFTQLFGYMFEDVIVIGPDDDATLLDIDALVEPSIDAFEFSVPNQSKNESFAVWIRYRIRVFDKLGTEVATWPVSAYGKSQTTTMGGSDALRRAAILAMRDAAALMIMQLDKSNGISLMAADATPVPTPLSDAASVAASDDSTQPASEGGAEDAAPVPTSLADGASVEVSDDTTQPTSEGGAEDDAI